MQTYASSKPEALVAALYFQPGCVRGLKDGLWNSRL
jgi:hypothetical protein